MAQCGKIGSVALTGGIACGKSLVASLLRARGIETLDADDVVHEILPEEERRRLVAEGVFRDETRRKALEARLWPLVLERFVAWHAQETPALRIAIIPLLFEARWDEKYDIICTVICEEATQLKRMIEDRGYSSEEAHGRLAAQMPVSLKAAKSHYVIHNDGTREQLASEVDGFVRWLKEQNQEGI